MLLPVLVLSGVFRLFLIIGADELPVIRHADGDIFSVEGSCNGACYELSSGTGSPYNRRTAISNNAISTTNGTCLCQCNGALPIFREDLHICVSDIHECSVTGFVSNSGLVEKVPYVFLPQRGQIIYPQAEIRFEGVTTPVCGIAGSQQLGKAGWLELRNLSNAEPPFRLFRDEGKTFLQWIGEDGLRDAAEGKVVVAKLVCRDASPNSSNPGVFVPCVAFRVAGSPSKSNIREVTFASTGPTAQGLSAIEYAAIGVSSVLLALIYVASVSLYLHSRKTRKKSTEEPEVAITEGRAGAGLVKNNPLLIASRHFESDTNSVGPSDDELGADELAPSDSDQGFENPSHASQQTTSAIIHPHCMLVEHAEASFGNGTILGERIPDEDVRIVETIENTCQQESCVLPGTQRRKLYFNPAYFERQLLLAPPPGAIEFLMKIREVISIAKHKMSAKRFVPTLTGIPEEETSLKRCGSVARKQRAISIQGSIGRYRKSQRCTGCPGCTEASTKNYAQLPEVPRSTIGENRIRAWLEDVKPLENRWKHSNEINFAENCRNISQSLEYLKEITKCDFLRAKSVDLSPKNVSTWKDNPPMMRTLRNIARSEILEEEDRQSVSKRSTKSMFEDSSKNDRYDRKSTIPRQFDDRENTINAKVRKAIENSFIKQMEENATFEDRNETARNSEESSSLKNRTKSNRESKESIESPINGIPRRWKKAKAPAAPTSKLAEVVSQLPLSKIPAKRIMDAVIREMVDVKALEHHPREIKQGMNYEIDSLERINRNGGCNGDSRSVKKIGIDDNAKNNRGERKISEVNDERVERINCFNKLPELLSQSRENYSLVSEVYVNDGYASPAGSDDSAPEISYEPENPGHLTIKVQDSPENYVRQDESEYEPDTLDRKPMRLKINGDVSYERDTTSESYVDSLERPGNILLRSKSSFRDDGAVKNGSGSLQRGYGSLREIYEARIRSQLRYSGLMSSTRSLNGDSDCSLSWKKAKYLTPDTRQAKRQRKPQNQPDVVPLPPAEEIYERPKPPRRVEYSEPDNSSDGIGGNSYGSKNESDRSKLEAGDPTASDGSPVLEKSRDKDRVGYRGSFQRDGTVSSACSSLKSGAGHFWRDKKIQKPFESFLSIDSRPDRRESSGESRKVELEKYSRRQCTDGRSKRDSDSVGTAESGGKCVIDGEDAISWRKRRQNGGNDKNARQEPTNRRYEARPTTKRSSIINRMNRSPDEPMIVGKIEDSGYLSSTDSNGSQKQLLARDNGSVSETDETESSIGDGASESGAESVGTDSVFFGNFRRLSDLSNFSKSVDSGVDFNMRNTFFKTDEKPRYPHMPNCQERLRAQASDSENDSFVTVLSPGDNETRRNSIDF